MKVIFENLSIRDWIEIRIAIELQISEVEECIQKWKEKGMNLIALQKRRKALIKFVEEFEGVVNDGKL